MKKNRENLIKVLFHRLEMRAKIIFRELIKVTKDQYLKTFTKIFIISLGNDEFDLLVDYRRYLFILSLGKTLLVELLNEERRYQKIMDDFEKSNNIDQILLILYKTRNKFSNINLIRIFFNKIEDLLEKDYTKSPLFMSKNPLKLCFLFHLYLYIFNKRLKLANEDYSRLSDEFMEMCDRIIEYLPQNVLDEYVFHVDDMGKIFLDYLFKSPNAKIAETRYIRNAIQSYWDRRIAFKSELVYYSNTYEIPKN